MPSSRVAAPTIVSLTRAPRDYSVRLRGVENAVLQSSSDSGEAFFATRIVANLPDQEAQSDSSRAVFLLDTSWSDRPTAFSRRLKLLESVLEENRRHAEAICRVDV